MPITQFVLQRIDFYFLTTSFFFFISADQAMRVCESVGSPKALQYLMQDHDEHNKSAAGIVFLGNRYSEEKACSFGAGF